MKDCICRTLKTSEEGKKKKTKKKKRNRKGKRFPLNITV